MVFQWKILPWLRVYLLALPCHIPTQNLGMILLIDLFWIIFSLKPLVSEPKQSSISLIPTCHKYCKNRPFFRFPDTEILTTIVILRTARFTLIGRIADCSWHLLVMVCRNYCWKVLSSEICFVNLISEICSGFNELSRHYDQCEVNDLQIDYSFHAMKFQIQLWLSFFVLSFWLHYSKLYIDNSMKIRLW